MNRPVSSNADARGSGKSPFSLDVRAVGLFRILFALVLIGDQLIRLGDWHAFHSVQGLVSLADSRAWEGPWTWSLYWISDAPWLPYVLEALRALATLTLLFGMRSRLSAFVLFVLLASVTARNPLLLQGGDKVLVAMAFFGCFLPLGERYSIERLWFGGTSPATCQSAGTAAYVIQILLVWFMGGVLKTGGQWWDSGTAVSMALHLEAFASEFARLWRDWDWLMQPTTLLVFWIECLAPLLLLAPNLWSRLAGLVALVGLEAGIWLNLEVGLFPFISVISMVPLIPHRCMEFIARRQAQFVSRRESDLVLFYDRNCRFCAFACRLLLAVSGIRGASLRVAQADERAARILDDSFSWSVTRTPGPHAREGAARPQAGYRQGWEAVRFLVRNSPRPWLLHLLPGATTGHRLYLRIGRNRGALGAIGAFAFGTTPPVRTGRFGNSLAGVAVTLVLIWNLVTYPAVRDRYDLRPWVEPAIGLLNLKQYWDMFAPHPYVNDFWHVMPALARDRTRQDLLSGLPVNLAPPVDGPDRYGGYRWRKIVLRSMQRGEFDRVLRYFCRTNRWTAIDLWEFSRPNTGTAATAQNPYHALLAWRWQCDNVNQDTVKGFRADVDATMENYRQSRSQAPAGSMDRP